MGFLHRTAVAIALAAMTFCPSPFGTPLAPASAAAQGSLAPARVFEVADLLQTHHIDAPHRTRLLIAALGGLRAVAARRGADPLPDLDTGSEANVRASFSERFAVAHASTRDTLSAAALEDAAIAAMLVGLGDRFTTLLREEQLAPLRSGGYGGIGVSLRSLEGRVYIWDVFAGATAAEAGVRALDQVLAIDGRSVKGLSQTDVVRLVRGPVDSRVRLTIRRPGRREPLTITVSRALVAAPTVGRRMLTDGIGYVRLHSLGPGAGNALAIALSVLQREGARAIVLDLRQNNFGSLGEVTDAAGALLPKGSLVYVVRGQESATGRTARTPAIPAPLPIVAIVDGETRGFAEVFAAALTESGRARSVGMQTARQGAYGRLYRIHGGGALLIKTSRIITGTGNVLEKNGVKPDIGVVLRASDMDEGRDPQLTRALQLARTGR